jgi:hypothetical protein
MTIERPTFPRDPADQTNLSPSRTLDDNSADGTTIPAVDSVADRRSDGSREIVDPSPIAPPARTSRRGFLMNTMVSAASLATATAVATPATAQSLDAELIDLGARFEPLLDQYYRAHRRWSGSLAQAHAEHDQECGTLAERNYEYPPEVAAAFSDSCKRSGADDASDVLSAIHQQMAPLANAINAAPINSIEGLRAKALVVFWEVHPLFAGSTEFYFGDAYPFQWLFTAVAEVCGLKDKIAATDYQLPEIDFAYDDSDDEGEDA